MKNLQKLGGIAALYLAASYLIGIILFLVVLDYPNIVDPVHLVGCGAAAPQPGCAAARLRKDTLKGASNESHCL